MNKVVVITGGSKGIGLAIARVFAKAGKDLAICARNLSELEKVKNNLESEFSIKCYVQSVDMSVKEDVLKFADYVLKNVGEIEVLVNNAGVFIPGQIHQEEDGALDTMINTNLYSAYNITRALIPSMISRKDGHVINICSIASVTPYENGGSYSISKYAMYGMTKVLREEMKEHGVRVTAILPGATWSDSWSGVDLPEERLVKPEDIAAVVFNAYTLSKQAVVEEIVVRPQLGDL